MIHLIALFVFTAVIIYLSGKIWKLSKEPSLIIGFFLLYYWTLAGSWFIVIDNMTNRFFEQYGAHYYYLFERLFTIHNDSSYLQAIIYYGSFLVIIQLTLLIYFKSLKPIPAAEDVQGKPVVFLNYWKLILISVAAVGVSFFFMRKQISYAISTEQSVYTITRMYTDRYTSLHQLANMVAVIPVYVGFLTLLSNGHALFFKEKAARYKTIAYVIAIIFVEGYLTFLGNKHEIFFGSILGILFFVKNYSGKINWKPVIIFLVIAGTPLVFNDVIRGFTPKVIFRSVVKNVMPLEQQGMTKNEPAPDFSVSSTTTSFVFSNEMFSAHFSMYGVLDKEVPPTYGSSLRYLAASMIPRAIVPDRGEDIYAYYAKQVDAYKEQGFTINHATGWYLNFGLAGLIIGAIVIGLFWGFLIRKANTYYLSTSRFLQILWFIAALTFVAKIPVVIRGGPEVYKALIFEGMLLPTLVLFISTSAIKKNG